MVNYKSERYDELRDRTKAFGLRAIRLFQSLPLQSDAQIIGKQLIRCATSVAANYRAACLAKSDRDLLNKLKICQEEADESTLWMEYLIEADIVQPGKLESLLDESRQLTAIMTASTLTITRKLREAKH